MSIIESYEYREVVMQHLYFYLQATRGLQGNGALIAFVGETAMKGLITFCKPLIH